MLTGGCLCGAVRYEASGEPYALGVCHCITCRRASGAAMVAWFSVKSADLKLTGELAAYASSDTAVRRFCARCGTQLIFDDARYPDEVDISTCSLDDPDLAQVRPDKHIWASRKLAWVRLADGLPVYPESSQ